MIRNALSILALVAAIGIFFFYTKPSYDGIQALAAQNSQYDQALAKATQLQTIKQSLLSRYNSFDPTELTRLSTMLPDQVDNIRLILDLDNIAGSHGMALQNVNISTPADQSQSSTVVGAISNAELPYDSLTLQFTTEGTYEQFKEFLSDLQSSLRIVDLTSLSIKQATASGTGTSGSIGSSAGDPVYTYTVDLQTYWLR